MNIITGKTGEKHVRSEDDRALHAGMLGVGNYILNIGSKLAASIESANEIIIADGDVVFQGTHARIRRGNSESCVIENGSTGYNRKDLIVIRYRMTSGIESAELVVLKGTPTRTEATVPAYTSGNILEGATLTEIPLYEVNIEGVNVTAVISRIPVITTTLENVFTKSETSSMIEDAVDDINSRISLVEQNTTERINNVYNDMVRTDQYMMGELGNLRDSDRTQTEAFDKYKRENDERVQELENRPRRIEGNIISDSVTYGSGIYYCTNGSTGKPQGLTGNTGGMVIAAVYDQNNFMIEYKQNKAGSPKYVYRSIGGTTVPWTEE